MKVFYYTILLILGQGVISNLYAQGSPQLQWLFNAVNPNPQGGNSVGNDVIVDASGNRYVTGSYLNTADFDPSAAVANLTSAGSNDGFIAKYDANGNYLWAKSIGSTGSDMITSIAVDNSGQVYVTGSFQGTVDFDSSSATANLIAVGNSDILIAKYDTNGNYIWAKNMGSLSADQGVSIALDSSNQIIISGLFQNTADFNPDAAIANLISAGAQDIFIAKYDTNGNYLWAKGMGSTVDDQSNRVVLDSSGQIYITGYFQGTADFDPSGATANLISSGGTDIFFAKYDANGNYLWAKPIGSVNTDRANGIDLDSNGLPVITGFFRGTVDFDPSGATANIVSSATSDIFIAKYDANGNYLWAKSIGNTTGGQAVAVDNSNQVYITGFFTGTTDFDPSGATANLTSLGGYDVYMAKYDANGNYIWAKNIGGVGSEQSFAITLDNNGQPSVTGSFSNTVDFDLSGAISNLTSGSGVINCFVASYTTAGLYNNALGIGGYSNNAYDEQSKAVVTDASGNVYVTGYFMGTADFDPSIATASLTAIGNQDIFIAKYNASGNYLWAKAIGGNGNEISTGIALDNSNQVYITGYFSGTADFDPAGTIDNLISTSGSQDIFIAKYDTNGNYVWAKAMGGSSTDQANAIVLDSNSNVYSTGYFAGTSDFDPSGATANLITVGVNDIYIAKYDTNGNYIWAKNIGGTSNDQANSIALDTSNQVNIVGYFNSTVDFDPSGGIANLISAGNQDIFIAKFDNNGNYLWAKSMGGTSNEQATSIVLDSSNQIYCSGYFAGTADFNPSATTTNLLSAGNFDIFIAKYDANGNYIWANSAGSTGSDQANALALDNSGQVYCTGIYVGTVDFDPSGTTSNLSSLGGNDIFISKYDTNGNYLWAKSIGGAGNELSFGIILDNTNRIYNVGSYSGITTTDFESLNTSGNLTASNSADMYVAQYKECTATIPTFTNVGGVLTVNTTADTYQWIDCANGNAIIPGATNQSFSPTVDGNYAVIIKQGGCESTSACQAVLSVDAYTLAEVKIYPNPTTGKVTITMPFETQNVQVEVTDMLGKVIKVSPNKEQNVISLSLDEVAKGVYFIRLQADDKIKTYKVIKQ